MQDQDPDFIYIPIPRRHYSTVMQALASAEAPPEPPASQETSGSKDGGRPVIEWTREDLERLARHANPTTRGILDLGSAQPGTWIALWDVSETTGRSKQSAKADMSGLGRRVHSRYGRSNLPFEHQWAAGGRPCVYYRVTPEVAEMWRDITTTDS